MSLMSGLMLNGPGSETSAYILRCRSSLRVPKGLQARCAVASLDRSIHISAFGRQRRSSAKDRSRLQARRQWMKGLEPTNQSWICVHVSRETVCIGSMLLS